MPFLHRLAPHRLFLIVLAAVGLFGLNGVFLYYALVHPETMGAALANPIALVFMLEAFVMVGFTAWVIATFGMKKPGWVAFVVLSLVGGLAFSVPAFLLRRMREEEARASDVRHA